MSALAQRWGALAPRERGVLAFGAVALVLILGYVLVWEPLQQARDALRVQVQSGEADLAWMRAAAPIVQQRGAAAPSALMRDTRSLLARADAGARDAGLGTSLLRVEPVSATQVRVYFQQAGFDPLMRWLETLSAQGIRVGELSVQRAEGMGQVDARLSLEETAP